MITISRSEKVSAYLGNIFEHYDTALFGFLSPFLAPLIFPKHDPVTALILTYAMIPLGMLARPLGSIVFGYIGDVYGRGKALFFTLAGMGIVSGCIAFTPLYDQVGVLAPLIFCAGRVLQNFFAAGETMGGAIFLLENTPEKRQDILSGLFNASTMVGHLLASLGVFLLSANWRMLYLLGSITAFFGCNLRKSSQIVESKAQVNLREIYWKPLLVITFASGFGSACYSIAFVLMNGFIPLVSSLTKRDVMQINTYLLIWDLVLLIFFGWLAQKFSRRKVMFCSSLSVVLFAIPLISLLKGASLIDVIFVRAAFIAFGVAFFAPFQAWACQFVPREGRYTIMALGYALGTQLLGSPAAAIALFCFQKTGMVSSVVWYWMALAFGTSIIGYKYVR